jgi:hypothetical protein
MNLSRRCLRTRPSPPFWTAQSAPFAARAQNGAKYRTVLIGSGWWGMNILNAALDSGACALAALCDVDGRMAEAGVRRARERGVSIAEALQGLPGVPWPPKSLTSPFVAHGPTTGTPVHNRGLQAGRARVRREGAHWPHDPGGGARWSTPPQNTAAWCRSATHRRASPHNRSAREFLRAGRGRQEIGLIKCFITYAGGPETPKPNVEPRRLARLGLLVRPPPLCAPSAATCATHGTAVHRAVSATSWTTPTARSATGHPLVHQVLWITDLKHPTSCHSPAEPDPRPRRS